MCSCGNAIGLVRLDRVGDRLAWLLRGSTRCIDDIADDGDDGYEFIVVEHLGADNAIERAANEHRAHLDDERRDVCCAEGEPGPED